jgi:histidinol-phosphate/aromatic aminotransferase/cobyric acid decarboxylase-like protein/choline kinase
MIAVILAAGFGSRLRPLTDVTPKTMVSVAGERIIDRIIAALRIASIEDAVVVLGYRGSELRQHLETAYPGSMRFTFVENAEYASTNNIHSLALALDHVDDDFLLIECDLFFEKALLRDVVDSPWPNVAVVARYHTGMDGTVLSTDGDGMVEGVFPTYAQGHKFDFSDKFKTLNIYKFSADFLRRRLRNVVRYYTQAHSNNSYYEVVLGIIIYLRSAEIRALDVSDRRWMEIDDMNDLVRAEYLFSPERRYDVLTSSHGGYWNLDVLDFCYIRNMYFPTAAVLSDLAYNLDKLLANYGSSQPVLNRKLSHYLLAPQECCCLLNGASQGIKLLPDLLGSDRVVTFTPTFDEYLSVFPHSRAADPDHASLVDLVTLARRERIDVVVVANPCNPTGRCYPPGEMIEFLEEAGRAKIRVVVDESFIDFAGEQAESLSGWMLATRAFHVIVLKSLSKSLGTPGLRLGYCLSADAQLIAALSARLPLWNVNSVAEYFLGLLLKYRLEIAASFQRSIADREALWHRLAALDGCQPYPSGGNFIMCRLAAGGPSASVLARRMLEASRIYIKDCTRKFPAGRGEFVRVAVRLPDENRRLVDELQRQYSALGAGSGR